MFVCSLIAYLICYLAILDNSIDTSNEILGFATNDINSLQDVAKNISSGIQNSSEIQIAMRYEDYDDKDNLVTPFNVNSSLKLMKDMVSADVAGVYCFGDNNAFYQSSTTSVIKKDLSQLSWYDEVKDGGVGVWFPPQDNSFVLNLTNTEFISYVEPFYDYRSDKAIGVILIELNTAGFFDMLKESTTLSSNTYYIADENDNIIFSSNQEHDISTFSENYFEELKKSGYFYSSTLSNDWKVIGTIKTSDIAINALISLGILLFILMIVAVIVSIIVSRRRAKDISYPISLIVDKINNVNNVQEGELESLENEPKTNADIAKLYNSFNTFVKNEKDYIAKIEDEQKKIRVANFKALQAQITPHFLYNTMDTIAWNIRLDEKEKAINGIMGLTKFFRASLSKGDDIVPLEQEFEQLKTYLEIQSLRYDDLLQSEVDFDESLNGYAIPKLSIQPLIENAIYHGIKDKGDFGKIKVYTKSFKDYYLIIVYDDGLGISKDKIEKINKGFSQNLIENESELINENSGYGMNNVNSRIKIYFGEEYGLFAESAENVYTKMIVKLPYMKKSDFDKKVINFNESE